MKNTQEEEKTILFSVPLRVYGVWTVVLYQYRDSSCSEWSVARVAHVIDTTSPEWGCSCFAGQLSGAGWSIGILHCTTVWIHTHSIIPVKFYTNKH